MLALSGWCLIGSVKFLEVIIRGSATNSGSIVPRVNTTSVTGKCSILNRLAGIAALADAFCDLQIGLPSIPEQFGEFGAHGRVLLEQQLFEHDTVDTDHLHQMRSEEVHENTRFE